MYRTSIIERSMPTSLLIALACVGMCVAPAAVAQDGASQQQSPQPSGQAKYFDPVHNLHLYLCGFHTEKANPEFQIEVQHYCAVGEELHQCFIFHTTEAGSKLLGVEYIIPDNLYQELSDEEKKYWHPHTYEVMSGQLIAPGMPTEESMPLMKKLVNTWGKTWHTWPDPTTKLPVGEPMLMWAVTADGQLRDELLQKRDDKFDVQTEEVRERRLQEMKFPVPSVPQPEEMDFIGRQWTAAGPDTPEARREKVEDR